MDNHEILNNKYASASSIGGIQSATMKKHVAIATIRQERESLETTLKVKNESLKRDTERKRMMDGHLAGLQFRMQDLENRKQLTQAELSTARDEAEQLRADLRKEKDEQYKLLHDYEAEMLVLSSKFQAGSVQYNEDAKLNAEMRELTQSSFQIRDQLSRARLELAEMKHQLDVERRQQPIMKKTLIDEVNMVEVLQLVCSEMAQKSKADTKKVQKMAKRLAGLMETDASMRDELHRIEVVFKAGKQ